MSVLDRRRLCRLLGLVARELQATDANCSAAINRWKLSMRFGRRAGQLIFDLMGKLRQVTERAQKIVSEKDGAVDSMRPADITETNTAVEQAIELWEQGQENKAVELMRRARLEYGPSSKLQFEYGRRALMLGQTWAAREALHDVVELDPIHLDALELFLEANYVSPGLPGVATEKVSVVAALLPYATDFDLDAASILLPSMPMVESQVGRASWR